MHFARIRMRFGSGGHDVSADAWNYGTCGYVGVWYGDWLPDDLDVAYKRCKARGDLSARRYLQEELETAVVARGKPTRSIDSATIHRFDDLQEDDWVVCIFGGAIHLAQIASAALEHLPRFDDQESGETFKGKPIKNKKSFRFSLLPDVYLLVEQHGRSNVFEPHSLLTHLDVLKGCVDERHASTVIAAMDIDRWIRFLGPSGWESICTAFLIREYGYMPTGLSVGRTLKNFDIVGRQLGTGKRICAQCKNSPQTHVISTEEDEAFQNVSDDQTLGFYFAFKGLNRSIKGVRTIKWLDMKAWLLGRGNDYYELLRSAPLLLRS